MRLALLRCWLFLRSDGCLLLCRRRLPRWSRASGISWIYQLVQLLFVGDRRARLRCAVFVRNDVCLGRGFQLQLVWWKLKKRGVLFGLDWNKFYPCAAEPVWCEQQKQDDHSVNNPGNPCGLATAIRRNVILIQVGEQQMQFTITYRCRNAVLANLVFQEGDRSPPGAKRSWLLFSH